MFLERTFLFIIALLEIGFLVNTRSIENFKSGTVIDSNHYATIRMKDAKPARPDDLICTAFKVNSTTRKYITGYIPHAKKEIAHHMLLFGCKKPAYFNEDPKEEQNWYCGPDSIGICERSNEFFENIIYAWALNAEGFNFPEGTGQRIGGDTDFQYLVLQMHYKEKLKEGQVDNSGLTIKLTDDEMPKQVGLYILANSGYVLPKTEEVHIENGCDFHLPFDIVPFRYRIHAHNLGKIVSGYVIKPNGTWYEIGRMSPKQPQLFYESTIQNMPINKGDAIVSRCTMNSMSRNSITNMGPRNRDEMCNFYVMYYTNYTGNIKDSFCFKDAQHFSWDQFSLGKIPENVSNLDGVILPIPKNEMNMNGMAE